MDRSLAACFLVYAGKEYMKKEFDMKAITRSIRKTIAFSKNKRVKCTKAQPRNGVHNDGRIIVDKKGNPKTFVKIRATSQKDF